MISGYVAHRRAIIPVTFRLFGHPDLVIEFVVDTGFAGFLTLPHPAVLAMGLDYQYHTPAGLADDSHVQVPVYEAIIVWEGVERAVRVLAMGKRALLGTPSETGRKAINLKRVALHGLSALCKIVVLNCLILLDKFRSANSHLTGL